MPPAPIEMPLPFSVRRDAIEPTIVTSSPSRIQTAPSPITTRQWKLDQGSRSSRPGMSVSIVAVSAVALWALKAPTGLPRPRNGNRSCMSPVRCSLVGHRYRFVAEGATMLWSCERCGLFGGTKAYPTPEDAARYAEAFDHEDRADLGRRAPLVGLFPLRLWRAWRSRR